MKGASPTSTRRRSGPTSSSISRCGRAARSRRSFRGSWSASRRPAAEANPRGCRAPAAGCLDPAGRRVLSSRRFRPPHSGRRDMGQAGAPAASFQGLILALQSFWADQGCVILQPYDVEVGAGTFHPATTLRALGPDTWNAAYVQPSRRPTDGRYGENPNRLQHYYQFQVIMKPSPTDIQE